MKHMQKENKKFGLCVLHFYVNLQSPKVWDKRVWNLTASVHLSLHLISLRITLDSQTIFGHVLFKYQSESEMKIRSKRVTGNGNNHEGQMEITGNGKHSKIPTRQNSILTQENASTPISEEENKMPVMLWRQQGLSSDGSTVLQCLFKRGIKKKRVFIVLHPFKLSLTQVTPTGTTGGATH